MLRRLTSLPFSKGFAGGPPIKSPLQNLPWIAWNRRLCYSLWLFYFRNTVKIQPFYPVSPLAGATGKAFCRLSLWSFREKSINHFLEHSQIEYQSFAIGSVRTMWLFHLHSTVKNTAFFPVFPLAEFMAKVFCWRFLWSFKEKTSAIFSDFSDTALP